MNQFILFTSQVTWTDFFDILSVSLILYFFLVIVQGTRAVQMIIGLFLLLGLFIGSLHYRFYTLNWILSHFFDSFFLILVILFQDQFRSALIRVGHVGFFGKRKQFDDDKMIDEVIEATFALAKERTGALMVFEKQNGLLNYIKTGTQINAQVHADLIFSLFQTNSPLHDGAIIFSAGKLLSAGCFLPLSKSLDIDRKYGTRHRAAIGLSEGTDAVIITVSEETGKINICYRGVFYPCQDENQTRRLLQKYLGEALQH